MLHFLLWYMTLSLFALAALPLGWSWFRHLPDRGWGLLRPLGLLLVGFAVWLLGSFGLLRLSAGSGLGALVALFALGSWVLQRWGGGWPALRDWLREQRKLLLLQEGLFLLLLAFWSWYRIHDRWGIAHTEQPMDFAFLNAILRGGEMPPNDPWLSGFAISYYYLGYLIMAQVAALSSVPSGVAYNLAFVTLAALAAVGSFSLAYNLLAGEHRSERSRLLLPFLAPLFLVGISNLTGLLTMLYRGGLGPDWLFNWLAVHGLTVDPGTGQRFPKDSQGWWWWEASRTVSDYGPDGGRIEVIDEFPFFSFMLGDMHPHVLALPFVLLGLALALNGLRGAVAFPRLRALDGAELPPESWGVSSGFGKLTLLLTMVIVGSMGMMNTWDFPTLGTIIAGSWLVAAFLGSGQGAGWRPILSRWLGGGLLLLVGALLLYLPFYAGFRSQAQGIRLSPFATLPQHYFLMFGFFWLVLLPLALSQMGHVAGVLRRMGGRTLAHVPLLLLLDGALLYFLLQLNLEEGRLALLLAGLWLLVPLLLISLLGEQEPAPLAIAQVAGFPLVAGLVTQRWTMVIVALLLALMLLALWARTRRLLALPETEKSADSLQARPAIAGGDLQARPEDLAPTLRLPSLALQESSLLFALGLATVGLLLTMGCEIFYIKDGFPGRMNTIFKLYYQAWTLMSLATVFGIGYLAQRLPLPVRLPWLALIALLVPALLWYPAEAIRTKADFTAPARWDGRAWMAHADPDRLAAIEWLNRLPGQVVIVEKAGDSYRESQSTLAGWTGHSTLLGWRGHELQWRGSYDEVARREPVIEEIYRSIDPARVRQLLEEWDIDYVAVTPLEMAEYQLSEPQIEKFREVMTPAFEQGSVLIFGR